MKEFSALRTNNSPGMGGDLLNRIGARIRQRRKELGLTQQELAGTEYTKSFISQLEQGRTWPSLPALVYIAQRLGRPVDWFLAEEDPPVPPSPVDELATELGVDPGRLREALVRVLFGR